MRAGEQSGQMIEVLDELSENLKWQDEMAGQAKKAPWSIRRSSSW